LSSIGRRFNRASSSIHPLLARTGGIRPPKRIRSRLALTLIEREEMSRGLTANLSLREIARNLGRAVLTVSREVGRNGGAIQYRAILNQQRTLPAAISGELYWGARCSRQPSTQAKRSVANGPAKVVHPETLYDESATPIVVGLVA